MTNFYQRRSATWLLIAAPVLLFALVSSPAADALQSGDNDPDRIVAGGKFPAGWNARTDRGTASQVMFNQAGNVFHFTLGPASTFYNAAWAKSGDYQFSARLTQMKAPSHPTSYGLMIGASDLAGPNQTYSYFLVRNQGDYFVANREAGQRPVIVDWTPHQAINKQGADGRQVNTLAVQVQGANVILSVNGTEVKRLQKSLIHTDGLNGFRIGHNLDVEIDQVSR